jgi:hypothetical protein
MAVEAVEAVEAVMIQESLLEARQTSGSGQGIRQAVLEFTHCAELLGVQIVD